MHLSLSIAEVCCKMDDRNVRGGKPPNSAEDEIVAQIADIERRIHDLMKERDALGRLLIKFRQRESHVRDVSRKNSVNRILIERQIIEYISKYNKPISSSDLFKIARVVDPDLKDSTFRSHIHRLFQKGLVRKGRERGYWTRA